MAHGSRRARRVSNADVADGVIINSSVAVSSTTLSDEAKRGNAADNDEAQRNADANADDGALRLRAKSAKSIGNNDMTQTSSES